MTDQALDSVINECPGVDLADLEVCYVLDGAPRGDRHRYKFRAAPDPKKQIVRSSSNWSGYTSVFRLTADGRLILAEFKYDSGPRTTVNEELEGDFWLVLANSYSDYADGKKIYVPFRDGRIIKSRSEWEFKKSEEELQQEARASAPVSDLMKSFSRPQKVSVIAGVLAVAIALVYVPFEATYTSPNSGNRYHANIGYHLVWSPPSASSVCRNAFGKSVTAERASALCFTAPSMSQVAMTVAAASVAAFAAFLVLGAFGRRP